MNLQYLELEIRNGHTFLREIDLGINVSVIIHLILLFMNVSLELIIYD